MELPLQLDFPFSQILDLEFTFLVRGAESGNHVLSLLSFLGLELVGRFEVLDLVGLGGGVLELLLQVLDGLGVFHLQIIDPRILLILQLLDEGCSLLHPQLQLLNIVVIFLLLLEHFCDPLL